MDGSKTIVVRLLLLLLIPILFLSEAAMSSAGYVTTQVGEDPSKDANPASVDILRVSLANNGTHFRFIIKCRATPEPSLIRSYTVWLDTKDGADLDYCLVAGGIPGLYEIRKKGHSIMLKYKAPIEVVVEGNSIYLTAKLSDIEYPEGVKKKVGIVVTTQQPLVKVRDRAPNHGTYKVNHEIVSELPGLTSFIFTSSILVAVYLIYRYKFKSM